MLSKELKETLYIQVEQIYAKTQANLSEEQIMERIEVFSMALSFASVCKIETLKDVENEISELLESIKRSARAEINEREINLLEPYLRLLCLLIDEEEFYKRGIETATLGTLYSYRKLDVLDTINHQERKNYYDILFRKDERGKPILYGDPRHPENVLKNDIEILPFVETYCLRNDIIHQQLQGMVRWNHFLAMFYTMIEVTYKNKENIIPQFIKKEISHKNYINRIIKGYEEKLGQNFTYIPLNIEVFPNDLYDILNDKYQTEEKSVTFETVNEDLNLNNLTLKGNLLFNKTKIIGYAGMGKTTTLENIIYQEALKIKKEAYQGRIPILIEMIKVTSPKDTIESLIARKLETDNMIVVFELIKRNMIKLYIDGINEIMISNYQEKREYLNKIEEFIIKNKELKVVVTDRDSNENSILNNYPTFILTGVTKENISKFIMGNSIKPEIVNKKILEKVEETPAFVDTLRNPFMLKNLITIVECNKQIPEYEDDIAEEFLKAIVERERVVKRDYKAPHILRLLIYVVGKYVEGNDGDPGDNMVISYYKLIDLFNEYCDKYKRNDRFDNDEMLDLIVKLGILKQIDTEKYTFVDEKYYNFFYYSAGELL